MSILAGPQARGYSAVVDVDTRRAASPWLQHVVDVDNQRAASPWLQRCSRCRFSTGRKPVATACGRCRYSTGRKARGYSAAVRADVDLISALIFERLPR